MQVQIYIPPKQPHCMYPLVSYTIESTVHLQTRDCSHELPPVALQVIANAIRKVAVIDGYRATVQILEGRLVRIHFPRAIVSYGFSGDLVPIYLPQVGEQCQDLAESLTRKFARKRGRVYKKMLLRVNRHLYDKVKCIYFDDFIVLNEKQNRAASEIRDWAEDDETDTGTDEQKSDRA